MDPEILAEIFVMESLLIVLLEPVRLRSRTPAYLRQLPERTLGPGSSTVFTVSARQRRRRPQPGGRAGRRRSNVGRFESRYCHMTRLWLRSASVAALAGAAGAWDPTPHYEMSPCDPSNTGDKACHFHSGSKVRGERPLSVISCSCSGYRRATGTSRCPARATNAAAAAAASRFYSPRV